MIWALNPTLNIVERPIRQPINLPLFLETTTYTKGRRNETKAKAEILVEIAAGDQHFAIGQQGRCVVDERDRHEAGIRW